MDLSKLSSGQKMGVGGAAIALISIFLPWFSLAGVSGNAFDVGFLAWFGSLLVVAGGVILALKAFGTSDVKMGTLAAEQIALVLAGLGTLFIVLKLILGHDVGPIDLDRSFGIFLATLAGLATTYGAFATMKEQGLELPDMDDFKSVTGGDDDGGGSS